MPITQTRSEAPGSYTACVGTLSMSKEFCLLDTKSAGTGVRGWRNEPHGRQLRGRGRAWAMAH